MLVIIPIVRNKLVRHGCRLPMFCLILSRTLSCKFMRSHFRSSYRKLEEVIVIQNNLVPETSQEKRQSKKIGKKRGNETDDGSKQWGGDESPVNRSSLHHIFQTFFSVSVSSVQIDFHFSKYHLTIRYHITLTCNE